MKKRFICFVFAFAVISSSTSATAANELQNQSVYQEDFATAQILQSDLKEKNRAGIANLLVYPIEREKPLPAIETPDEFLKNWNDFFDDAIISRIVSAKPEVVGWRGVMLSNGDVWFNDGKIDTVNTRTEEFAKKLKLAREEEYKTLYKSARGYKIIRLECNTAHSHVRIQEHDDGLHYFAWKNNSPLSEKPFLSLKGRVDIQGSAGNMLYTFKDGADTYEIDDSNVCEGVCKIHLAIIKNGITISNEICE